MSLSKALRKVKRPDNDDGWKWFPRASIEFDDGSMLGMHCLEFIQNCKDGVDVRSLTVTTLGILLLIFSFNISSCCCDVNS